MPHTLSELNASDRDSFVRLIGPIYEHSPWIADRAWSHVPFASIDQLLATLSLTVRESSPEEQLALIQAHPDLVGRAVLTSESQGEQAAAGLTDLTPKEIAAFSQYNRTYRERFGFPFVICAGLNKKAAILKAFPIRLANTCVQEIATALGEIDKIAALRLADLLRESDPH